MPPKKKTQLEKQHEKFAARYAARKKLGGLGVPGMYGPLTMDQDTIRKRRPGLTIDEYKRINRTGKRLAAIQAKALRAQAIRARKEGIVQHQKDREARKRARKEGLVQRKRDRAARKAMLAMFKADHPAGYGGIRGIKMYRGKQYEKFLGGTLPDIDHANHIYFQELARRKRMYAKRAKALKARRADPDYVARPRKVKAQQMVAYQDPVQFLTQPFKPVSDPVVGLVEKAAKAVKKSIEFIAKVSNENAALKTEVKNLKKQKQSPSTSTRSRSAKTVPEGRPKRATKAPNMFGYP
jgi:hypothetical protein